jgi:hypothetical protein
MRPAFNLFFVASLNAMTTFSSMTAGDITLEMANGCHELWNYH